ncbi:MAG: hypothetical protein ACLR4Z_01820 [Butyricicoccaceae bacterium]
MLEPTAMQNAEPVFCMKDLIVEDITPLSSDRHVRLSLSKDGTRLGAIWFGTGAGGLGFVPGSTVDAAFHLEINEYHKPPLACSLIICDVQLSECEHRADQLILNLYNILMQDGPLTALEARRLLPEPQGSCRRLAAYRLPRGGRTALRARRGAFAPRFLGEQTRDQHRQAPRLARRLFRVRPHQLPFQRGHDKRLPQALRG